MSSIKKVSIYSVFSIIIAYSINKALRIYCFSSTTFFLSTEEIFGFNFFLSLITVLILFFIHHKLPDKVGYTYLGFSVLKMMFSVYYLYPLIQADLANKIPDVLNFFCCYFLFLILESKLAITLLNTKK